MYFTCNFQNEIPQLPPEFLTGRAGVWKNQGPGPGILGSLWLRDTAGESTWLLSVLVGGNSDICVVTGLPGAAANTACDSQAHASEDQSSSEIHDSWDVSESTFFLF